jgi:hypothetical protein
MAKEYLVFVEDIKKDLPEECKILLTIKDLTTGPRKYDTRIVKAIVSSSPEKLPESAVLWVRSWTGVLYPYAWAIKIIEEIGEVMPGIPHGETLATKLK